MPRTDKTTRTAASKIARDVKEHAHTPHEDRVRREFSVDDLVPSGSTMLNLACSDNPHGAYLLGSIVSIPGASSAGKTILGLTCLAECAMLDRFADYDLIHDDAEHRLNFDIPYLFGNRVADRIVKPKLKDSNTIQDFESNVMLSLKGGKPFVYVLDSFDSLSSEEELEKEYKRALAAAKSADAAAKVAGSFGAEKAKIIGQTLRIINTGLESSRSLLIILQQRRQKMNAPAFSDPWTTAGGEAPYYYSNHQLWMDKVGQIKKRDLIVGTETRVRLKKNSITGKLRNAEFEIYNDYGIDDTGSVVDYLLKEGHWTKKGHDIQAEELNLSLSREKLIHAIEEAGLQTKLAKIAGRVWSSIENEVLTKRVKKYE